MGAQVPELLRRAQEGNDLLQLLLLLVRAGHVAEGNLLVAGGQALDMGLPEPGHFVAARPGAGHAADKVQQQHEPQDRQHVGQQGLQHVGAAGVIVVVGDDARRLLLHHQVVHVLVEHVEIVQAAGGGGAVPQLGGEAVVDNGELRNLLLLKQLPHFGVRDAAASPQGGDQIKGPDREQHKKQDAADADASLLLQYKASLLLSR